MAITYSASSAGGGTSGSGDRTLAFTPAVGDLVVLIVGTSGNTNSAPTCTDNQSGTYDLVLTALKNSSADTLSVFVRKQLVASAVSHTATVATGSNTAGEIVAVRLVGSLRVGLDAVRQFTSQANQAAGGTPAPVFSASALTSNCTITGIFNSTAAGSVLVPNASWTERQDVSQSTPTTGVEVATRDSGFTGTTITAGGTSTAFASYALEMQGEPPEVNLGSYFDEGEYADDDPTEGSERLQIYDAPPEAPAEVIAYTDSDDEFPEERTVGGVGLVISPEVAQDAIIVAALSDDEEPEEAGEDWTAQQFPDAEVAADFIAPPSEAEQEEEEPSGEDWALSGPSSEFTTVDAITAIDSGEIDDEEATDDWSQFPTFDEFPLAATLDDGEDDEQSGDDWLGAVPETPIPLDFVTGTDSEGEEPEEASEDWAPIVYDDAPAPLTDYIQPGVEEPLDEEDVESLDTWVSGPTEEAAIVPLVLPGAQYASGGGAGKKIRPEEWELFRRIDRQLKLGKKLDRILEELDEPEVAEPEKVANSPRVVSPRIPPAKRDLSPVAAEVATITRELQSTRASFAEFELALQKIIETGELEARYSDEAALLLILAGVL